MSEKTQLDRFKETAKELECEEGESPEDVARRETREEANCEVSDLAHISTCLPSVGGIHGCNDEDEDEDIRVIAMPFDKALAMIERGEIADSAALISPQWLALNRDRLREEWS